MDADDSGPKECLRIEDRAIDVALGGDVEDGVRLRGQRTDRVGIGDVALDEGEPGRLLGVRLDGREVRPVARIGELVEDRDSGAVATGQDAPDELAADEPGAARDQQVGARCDPGHHFTSLGCADGAARRPARSSTSASSAARRSDGTVPASIQFPS